VRLAPTTLTDDQRVISELTDARALQIFEQALACREAERAEFIAQACGDDVQLSQEVLSYIGALAQSEGFLEVRQAEQALGPYRLLHSIGRGGMGEVWLAERADGAYAQKVAIKLMHAHVINPELQARALAERQFLAELNHPNIARLLDAGSSESGQLYVVMEYVEGLSIDQYANQQKLDVRARVLLFLKVLDAIDSLHRRLIIHRDLKSANIMVDAQGEPKLLDFGIAKSLGSNQSSQTQTGVLLLTPSNASPEQLEGKSLDTTSDLYSACTVLFQLLTGRLPREIEGQANFEAARRLAEIAAPSLSNSLDANTLRMDDLRTSAWRKALRGDLEAIVGKALRYEPHLRYRSAREFAEDLQRWLDQRPVLARQGGFSYAARKYLSRNRWPLALASAVLAALCVGLGLAWHQNNERLKEAERTELIKGFLADVISRANPFSDGGELTVAQAIDQAAAEVEQRFSKTPVLEADVRFILGSTYLQRDELNKAQFQLERSLNLARAHRENRIVSACLSGLAQLNWSLGKVDQSIAQYEQANALLDWEDPERREQMLSNYSDLAQIYSDRGDVAKSISIAEIALSRWQLNPHNVRSSEEQYARLLRTYAFVLHGDPKRLQEAADYYQRALLAWRKLVKEDNLDIAAIQNNEAKARMDLGQLDAAIILLESSIKTRERLLPAKHWMRVVPYGNLANIYSRQSEHARACTLMQTALSNARNSLTADDPAWIRVLDNGVQVAQARGDAEQAKLLAQRALAIKSIAEVDPDRVQRLRNAAVTSPSLDPHFERCELPM
jgi:eukaryotic-like serine/threonine-protein kinase